MSEEDQETLFEFPCEFPIKVMGASGSGLVDVLRRALANHAPDFADVEPVVKASSKGRYVGVTVTITATSKAQLDAIYQELTAADEVLFAL